MKFNSDRIVYWVTTGLFSLVLVVGGAANVLGFEEQAQSMRNLGYPAYLMLFLGPAKLFAVGAVLAPGLPLLKEWAYAGLCFLLMGAAYSHIRAGDPTEMITLPIFVWAAGACSYFLRPPGRRL